MIDFAGIGDLADLGVRQREVVDRLQLLAVRRGNHALKTHDGCPSPGDAGQQLAQAGAGSKLDDQRPCLRVLRGCGAHPGDEV